MALADGALGGFPYGGEGRHQDIVERLAVGDLFLEVRSAGAQSLVGELHEVRLERVDGVDAGLEGLDAAFVRGAENLAGERADHTESPSNLGRCRCGILANPIGRKAAETDHGRGNTGTFMALPRLPEFRRISSVIDVNGGRLCGEIRGGYIV